MNLNFYGKKILPVIACVFLTSISGSGQDIKFEPDLLTKDVELLILSKPSYTNIGRRKNIKGWVSLQVTFMSNGEIGGVVYEGESSKKKKLMKYGLVEQAIKAANKIKFKPAEDEFGLPVTITKTIKYFFTIY